MNLKKLEFAELELVDPNADYSGTQTIFIDFDGASGVSYDNDALNIYVNNIDIEDSGISEEKQFQILTDLNSTFADTGVTFTVIAPTSEEYSTIYVGGNGSAFSEYGNFLGLSETIDAGNQIKNDEAFVFSDKIDSTITITETITHEAAHLLGYKHEGDSFTGQMSISNFAAIALTIDDVSRDAYVVEAVSNSNFNNDFLVVTRNADASYIKFDIDDIPIGSDVQSAKLRIYGDMSVPYGASGAYLDVSRVKGYWTETGITWNSQPSAIALNAALFACSYSSGITDNWFEINVTDIVEDWIEEDESNHGFKLSSNQGNFTFRSDEYSSSTYDPQLIVEYIEAPKPDLKFFCVSDPSDNYIEGQQYTLEVTVENDGAADATSDFKVKTWLSLDTSLNKDIDFLIGEKTFSSIEKDKLASQDYTFTMPDLDSGDYSFYVITEVDSDNSIDESNESNTFITTATYSAKEPEQFLPYFYDARVVNLVDDDGDGFSHQMDIEFDVDSNISGNCYVKVFDHLGSHLATSSTFSVNGTIADYQSLSILIDDSNVIRENGTADFQLQLHDASTHEIKDSLSSGDDSDLINIKVEPGSEDYLIVDSLIAFNTWSQSGVYNDYCPIFTNYNSTPESIVGCVSTAVSQVLYYWNYPKKITFDSNEYIYINRSKIEITENAADTWDFATISVLNSELDSMEYDLSDDEKAYLSFGVGIKYNMNYTYDSSKGRASSGAYLVYGDNDVLKDDFGFGSAEKIVFGSYTNASQISNTNKQRIIDNIQKKRPVLARIGRSEGAHAVIIEGYKEETEEFYFNMGWGGTQDGWYSLDDIGNSHYGLEGVVLDIIPETSWGQSEGNLRSSRSSSAFLPTEAPNSPSWVNSVSDDYNNVIIGSGGVTFAATDNTIYAYDAFGSYTDSFIIETSINESITGIGQPQYANDNLYVLTSDQLIKINIDSKEQEVLVNNGEYFDSLKIDNSGNVFLTDSNAEKIMMASSNGLSSISYSLSGDIESNIAVDETNEKVFATWVENGKNNLGMFDYELNLLSQYILPEDVTRGAHYSPSPAISEDGTLYIGSRTNLYAFDVTGNTLNKKWAYEEYDIASFDDSVGIGDNGRIYVTNWVDDRHVALIALDDNSSAATVAWEKQIYLSSDYDNSGTVYIGGNGVVMFTTHIENGDDQDTYDFYAVKDNGTDYTDLWNTNNIEYEDGLQAIVASNKFIVFSGNTISSYKTGDQGDPYGAGMGYENNHSPELTQELNSNIAGQSVTLNWKFDDPDGHNVYYDVFISNPNDENGMMDSIATNITGTSLVLDDLTAGENYLWQVIAHDGQAYSDWAIGESFTISDDDGVINPYISLDGINDYVDCGSGGLSDNPVALTQSVWVRTSAEETSTVMTKRHEDDGSDWPSIVIENGVAGICSDDKLYLNRTSGTSLVNDNGWHNIIGVRNGNQYSIYVDGTLEKTESYISYNLTGSSYNYYIGYHGAWNQYFNGDIDEAAVWSDALSAEEIATIYTAGRDGDLTINSGNYVSSLELDGYWRFNAVSGNTAIDSSVNGNNATIITVENSSDSDDIIATSDFDSNGKSDILWRNQSDGTVGMWGDGVQTSWNNCGIADINAWEIVGVGDFYNDGKSDILWRNKSDGTVGMWGDGVQSQWNNSGIADINAWEIVGVGDFYNDGKDDVLWRNQSDGTVGMWGDGVQTQWNNCGIADISNWEIVGVGDFYNDGKDDVLWRNQSDGTVGMWGDGVQTNWNNSGIADINTWEIVGVGDFYNDGKDDVLWRNKSDGTVGMWGDGVQTSWNNCGIADINTWKIVGVGDFYNDGKDDILWRNQSNGDVGMWGDGVQSNWNDSGSADINTWAIC